MNPGWDLLVARDDLSRTELVERSPASLSNGEALLKVDRVGMTANNVTYALAGDQLGYWGFFPAKDGWGRVPLWGFADVIGSRVPGVEAGARVYGYLPTSSDLAVRPDPIHRGGFGDGSEHRADLPGVYNRYALTSADPSYSPEEEDLAILYRPLFFTSFILEDFVADNDYFGAEAILMSSASSKTAYGTAFCLGLREQRPKLVALTSSGNVEFTRSLGCYDEVVTYDDLESVSSARPTLYIDVAGNQRLRVRIHEHFGAQLVYDAEVGAAHMEGTIGNTPAVQGPRPQFFFAPAQIQKRREEWGPGEVQRRYADVWRAFASTVRHWVDLDVRLGPEGLKDAWLEVLAGRNDPRRGIVIDL